MTQLRVPRPAVEVDGLSKTYPGGVHAVRGIGFTVDTGEVLGLLGPNGAGKSTTIGMLTTTVRPTSGTARVGGHDVVTHPRDARAVSATVFQEPVVDQGLSGRRNLEIHARLWGVDPRTTRRRIDELVERFGIGEAVDRPVRTVSGGQRRRLEIARALLSEPRVLFLDEPTVGLDPQIRHELLDVVAGLRARAETTIMLTTHYLDEAERLCDRVAVVHLGRIVALDSPAALLAGLGPEIVELRVHGDGGGALAALRARGIAADGAFAVGSTVTLPVRDGSGAESITAIRDLGLATTSIGTRRPTLDDVYLRLTGARIAA
jgi:ABC-2 type transport system ATP-binding protein